MNHNLVMFYSLFCKYAYGFNVNTIAFAILIVITPIIQISSCPLSPTSVLVLKPDLERSQK